MKKSVLLVLVIGVLGAVGSEVFTAEERKGPRLFVKEERYDFGKVVQDEQAVHVFEIQNAGDEPLVIERVQTS